MICLRYCLLCKKEFKRQLSPDNIKRGKGKYCSKVCCRKHFDLLRKEGKIKIYYEGLKFGRLGKNILDKESFREKISKSLLGKTGELSRNWKGGVNPINNSIRRRKIYKEWRKMVYERDNYTCQICGIRGIELHANHIKKFSDYPDLRFEINNGITLCKRCHQLVTWNEQEWESYFNFCWENKFLQKGGII